MITLINKLQLLQNACARFVSQRRKFDHISDVLKDLHWLPVKARINYKILTWVYKCLNGLAPTYLSDLLIVQDQSRTRRSVTQFNLRVPRITKKNSGDRAFCVAGPLLWNRLPLDIKQSPTLDKFRRKLKTHLFIKSYGV